ncbi:ABC transporter ATP-binding protein [Methylovirgula sp. 4M-Z18]|uniref:ABC transporter ATP-binding protein n=1 Tax=Methylovirgula sp. 4M-Z18 TaxID=2293567 RepID=UPI000E2E669A|nr:ABC transporter ATP-binding protein [Methylovirgula sp. 4M-Z18]RFB81197.1 ABC transporter ATP-binding protein [Methylovirgula sp. 4M-Z18]
MTPLLQVNHLAKSYGGVKAVKDVSFTLRAGESLALIGPNGAGKSTCFNMLNGQIAPNSGTILLDDRNITGLKPHQVCRLGVGRTFQITATFASMTVIENIQTALMSHAGQSTHVLRDATQAFRAEAAALLSLTGMAEHAARPCGELAYGDLKRLELAIALANEPKLLLMDEPTAGMAPKERATLMRLVARIAKERNMGLLFTEHDMDVVFEHATRVLVLSRGELIAQGTPQEIRNDANVRAIYLGDGLLYHPEGKGAA